MAAAEDAPWPGALAVSGGADSLALMHLAAAWARGQGLAAPVVLTVDHRLQPGSRRSAEAVVAAAAALGLQAHILTWRGAKPASDLEAAARDARYGLLGRWCRRHGVHGLYLGHSRDDLAETFLLRLARGSGLDGLAAMPAVGNFPLAGFGDLKLVRPLLDIGRGALRAMLAEAGVAWHDDPMNDDPRFARVRLRQAWPALEVAGLSVSRIADAARHLARARAALEIATEDFLAAHAVFDGDGARLDGAALIALPRELGLRALAAVLSRIGGQAYRPRFARLERLYDDVASGAVGKGRTLAGCRIGRASKRAQAFGCSTLSIAREQGRSRSLDPKSPH